MSARRRIAAFCGFFGLALLLTGCAPPDFAGSPTAERLPLPNPSPARIDDPGTDPALIMADGARLALRVWLPPDPAGPKAVILALHGFNDYSHAFAMPAAVWATEGIATYAYDQRGFGANPDPGRWPGAASLCDDIRTAVALVQGRWPGRPVYLLGESMGGAEVLGAMGGSCGPAPRVAGVILVAPAVWGRHSMPAINRIALWSASRLFPDKTFTGSGFGVLASDNIPMLRALGRDPLFIKATRSDTIFGLADVMDAGYGAPPVTSAPVLLLYGAHDELIPPRPMRSVALRLAEAPDAHATIAFYPKGWHMLLRDKEGHAVALDVSHWIAAPAAPLPSGADRLAPAFLNGRLPAHPPRPIYKARRIVHERG